MAPSVSTTALSLSTMPAKGDRLRCRWHKCAERGPFSDDEKLFEHLNDAHNPQGVRPDFRCKWAGCMGRFQPEVRNARVKHLISHTEYRPHACDVCGASFKLMSHLNTHLRRHVADEEGIPDDEPEGVLVDCKACDKAFSRASALRAHMHFAHYRQSGIRTRRHRDRSGVPTKSSQSEPKGLVVEDWSDEEDFSATHLGASEPADVGPDSENSPRHPSELLAKKKRIEELELQRADIEALLREAQADLALAR